MTVNPMGRYALENGPDVEEDDGDDTCTYCAGFGGWTSTFIDSNDRECDADYDCKRCGGSGKR